MYDVSDHQIIDIKITKLNFPFTRISIRFSIRFLQAIFPTKSTHLHRVTPVANKYERLYFRKTVPKHTVNSYDKKK